ncbi:MAG: 30S ribosomal protein S20 [Candidatus Goldbacteria bacterium]|jgi:small subunit ribosomal protein S20|nr:30S ribosomal protein S20 [Candidatus Goldiibacteriota bacterium]PKL91423.1 MAG: 30S ribosomal protein S20 [Candidatus Goldiibacteriota bacterium HGW-Goldbacteria-1]
MPNLNASKKDLRKTKKRTASNSAALHKLRTLMKKAKASKDPKEVIEAVSFIDKAAKKGIIKKNAASRYKSRIAAAVKVKTA